MDKVHDPTHTEIIKAIRKVESTLDTHSNNLAALADTVEAHVSRYETDRAADKPVRELYRNLYTVGRVGSIIRSTLGWLVVVVGGSILIAEYAIEAFSK